MNYAETSEVIVCMPNDPRLARKWDQRGGWEQTLSDDRGPVMIVIGTETSDEQLEKMAKRFGVSLVQLRGCREALH